MTLPFPFSPLNDLILVEVFQATDKSEGGIILPDIAKEKPRRGKVLAVGPGKMYTGGYEEHHSRLNFGATIYRKIPPHRVPSEVSVGDTVLFGRYAGQEVTLDGKEYIVMKEHDLLAREVPD
jgi:chaperonin GroES